MAICPNFSPPSLLPIPPSSFPPLSLPCLPPFPLPSRPPSPFLISGPPIITEHPSPNITEVAAGDSITLHCAGTGNPRPTISWSLNGQPLPQTPLLLFPTPSPSSSPSNPYSTRASLSIGPLTHAVSGVYRCSAEGRDFNGRRISALSLTSEIVFTCEELLKHFC